MMASHDPRIDAYIAKSADFAKPILDYIRETVHTACPNVEETMKWSTPHFVYAGGILCGMASFKEHCAFGFWKGSLIVDADSNKGKDAMGQFGRITKIGDLPSKKILTGYVKQAMKLNEEGVKTPARSKPKVKKPDLEMPASFDAALKKNRKARTTFDALSPSHRREYVEWIANAKADATKERRTATAIDWLSEGKSLNWKYERTPSS
jgi:uncharacterized protein YdeI (YjbR/CyaY-like superfamily)